MCHRYGALFEAAATVFAGTATESGRRSGTFRVALAGGSTPKRLYSLLANDVQLRSAIPWDRVEFFWGDERHVPPEHPDSNYRIVYEAMLSRVPAQPRRVHRIRSEHPDAAVVANWYEVDVRASVGSRVGIPRFDLVVLGIGTDRHTASLFRELQHWPSTSGSSLRIGLVIASRLGLRLMLFNDVSHYAHQLVLACSSHTETALARR